MKPTTTLIVLGCTFVALGLFAPNYVHAQTNPSGQVAAQQAANSAGAQPAVTRKTTGTITGGVQFQSGTTNLRGVDVQFGSDTALPHKYTFVTFGHFRYGRTTIYSPTPITAVVAERVDASAGLDHNFGAHGIFMERTIYAHDVPQDLRHRIQEMAGVGVRYAKEKKYAFRFVPGVSVLNENKDFAGSKGVHGAAGFFEDLHLQLGPVWSFDQRFFDRHRWDNSDDFAFDGAAALTGAVTRTLGLQLQYAYTHENLVRPGAIKRYQSLQAGLQYRF